MNPWTNLDKDLREAIHYPKSYLKEHEDEVVSLLGISVEEYLKENKKRLEALKAYERKSEKSEDIDSIDENGLLKEDVDRVMGEVESIIAFCAPFYLCAPDRDISYWEESSSPLTQKWLKKVMDNQSTSDYVWIFSEYDFKPFETEADEGDGITQGDPITDDIYEPSYVFWDIKYAKDDFLDEYQKALKNQ